MPKPLILFSYIITLLACTTIILYNMKLVRQKINQNKHIYQKWSTKFNLNLGENIFRVFLIVLFLLWCLYLIKSNPSKNNGHYSLMLLLFLLSFAPRWQFAMGSTGVLIGGTFLRWEDISNWKIVEKFGRKKIELMWQTEKNKALIKKSVVVPPKFQDKVFKLFKKHIPST